MFNREMEFASTISIDVEGWAQSTLNPNLPITNIARDNTLYLLDLLDENGISATMFVLGKFAKKFPTIVKRISESGHEIASHGYGHIEAYKQSDMEFKVDITDSKNMLEDIVGKSVIGYRAPCFSILKENIHMLKILAEVGYVYDSSIFPVKNSRYGIKNFSHTPQKICFDNNSSIIEFPISACDFYGLKFPIAGGGYHRLLPGFVINLAIEKLIRKRPYVYYCHPYEFNEYEFKRLDIKVPWKTKFHQGVGRGKPFEKKFVRIARRFGSKKFVELVSELTWPSINFKSLSIYE